MFTIWPHYHNDDLIPIGDGVFPYYTIDKAKHEWRLKDELQTRIADRERREAINKEEENGV